MISNYKKIVALLLAFLFFTSLAFTGCTKDSTTDETTTISTTMKNTTATTTKAATATTTQSIKEFSYPMEGNKTLTYWVMLDAQLAQLVTNFSDTPLGHSIEEKTGVVVKYLHPAASADGGREAFNLLIASGDYPDIVEHNFEYVGGPEKAISEGFYLDLTDKREEFAPNITKYYEENPVVEKMSKTDSGKHYRFPMINGGDSLKVYFGPIIRDDWLDDLGLALPETIDEWYNMLKKFKDEKGAEAPLSFEYWMFGGENGSAFLGAYGVSLGFYRGKDGKIKYGQIEPGYKDFLAEFSKWYSEGLLDQEIFSVNSAQVGAKITGGETGAALGYQAGRLGNWLGAMKDDPTFSLTGARMPVLNKGDKPMFSQKEHSVVPYHSAHVTTGCKDVETAMRFLDYGYSEEGRILYNFGVEGVSYDMIDGYPRYTDHILKNPKYEVSFITRLYIKASYGGPFVIDPRYFEQYGFTYEQQKTANTNWSYSDMEKYRLPPITPTAEESQEVATIMGEINTYVNEMQVRYILGQEELDSFDTYVENIKKMGIDKVLKIYTDAVERFDNR